MEDLKRQKESVSNVEEELPTKETELNWQNNQCAHRSPMANLASRGPEKDLKTF